MKSWLVFAVCVSSTGLGLAQEEAVEAVEAGADVEVEGVALAAVAPDRLGAAVDAEMKILQKLTKLSDESIVGLKLGLQPFLSEEKKRFSGGGAFFGGTELLSPKTLEAIANAAEAITDNEQLVDRYRQDAKTRSSFQRDAAVTSTLATIDSWVGLASKQVTPVRKTLENLYEEGQLNFTPSITFQTIGGAKKLKAIEPLLTKEQVRYFKRFGKENASGFAMTMEEQKDEDKAKARDELKEKLRDVAEMKIARLTSDLNLTTKQQRRLQLLGKRVVSQAIDQRIEAEDKYREYMEQAQAGVPGPLDQEAMSIVSAHPVQLFDIQDGWNKYVKGALNDEQEAKLTKLNVSRGKRNAAMLSYMLVMSLGREIKLNSTQQLATYKMFAEKFGPIKMPSMMGLGMMDTYAKLLDITEDQYQTAMGEENWNKFKPLLGQVRTQLDQMKQAKEKAEEEE